MTGIAPPPPTYILYIESTLLYGQFIKKATNERAGAKRNSTDSCQNFEIYISLESDNYGFTQNRS